jgi:hypothetical protein
MVMIFNISNSIYESAETDKQKTRVTAKHFQLN